jgi:hypothetical protein
MWCVGSERFITFAPTFKVKAVKEYQNVKLTKIFVENVFMLDIVGKRLIQKYN